MGTGGVKQFRTAMILVLILVGMGAGLWWLERYTNRQIDGSVETIATASLQGLREQARLVPFVARFVAVTTSEQSRFGLSAKQTMILPGLVRYELDLNQITARDVAWDEKAKTLTVYLPPLILTGPEVDLKGMQVYDGGGILMALTDAQKTLDEANKDRGQRELLAQARSVVPMNLARDAARSAIERSFAMPLRAAGIDARVTAQFK
ncbi:MAG TPA: DUF4230 domain-containing protein [Sphingobium sp.]|uniref:DUF4230 domain-containing protein n=1 Tax=Sphingobium sp. TaxID=1912891 RepID=UPI002ED0C4AC